MILQGKLKQDFTDWYERTYKLESQDSTISEWNLDTLWGNLTGFADEHDMDLVSFRWQNKYSASIYENNYKGLFDKMIWNNDKSKTMGQARTRGITKFIEVYNDNRT